jgi:hypothetical protein
MRWVLGDVGDPRPVRPVRTELALDQVGDCFLGRHAVGPAAQREPGQPGPLHEQRHRVVADQQPVGALQLGADPGPDVGAIGGVTGLPPIRSVSHACRIDRTEGARACQS